MCEDGRDIWRPIETAPRDREILLVIEGRTRVGFWHQPERDPQDPSFDPGPGGWVCYPSGEKRYESELQRNCEPTAWAVMPSP